MRSYTELLSDLLTELKNNILVELSKSNPTYENLKLENDQRLVELQNLAPEWLLDDYIGTQYALASFETNYCYICGIRDGNKPEKVNPASDVISQELYGFDKYLQWHSKSLKQYNELQEALPQYCHALLTQYKETWDIVLGIEKHYCYSGGVFDKARLYSQLDLANKNEWKNLLNIFL